MTGRKQSLAANHYCSYTLRFLVFLLVISLVLFSKRISQNLLSNVSGEIVRDPRKMVSSNRSITKFARFEKKYGLQNA